MKQNSETSQKKIDETDHIKLRDEIVHNEDEALQRAIDRWKEFYQRMWYSSNVVLESTSHNYSIWGIVLRLAIIILSSSVTVLSNLEQVTRNVVTIIAGLLTLLTGIEAFFKLLERRSEVQQQQREIQSKRDELAYEWMIKVELEEDSKVRLNAAKRLLLNGPKAFNEIQNKYTSKAKEEKRTGGG
jgi:hypothetical protein